MTTPTTVEIAGQLWTLGPLIGSGGFGRVHMAESGGRWAVVKLVEKRHGADRELLLASDLRGVKGVVPVLGIGETADDWALLMPRADTSLRQYLIDQGGPLPEPEALRVLIDLAHALVSLAAIGVVHRDLKPGNVLLYQGTWCLGDFGASRYAEASTAVDPTKGHTTWAYRAPEQWRRETATAATDVYAFGVISHELLAGYRPFAGQDETELGNQHLHQDPPVIQTVVPPLAALVEECLFKVPTARPSAHNLLSRLERQTAASPVSLGLTALQEANLAAATERATRARQQSQARSESERRGDLLRVARQEYEQISLELNRAILSAAPMSEPRQHHLSEWELVLGPAAIQLSKPALVTTEQPENGLFPTIAGRLADWTDPADLPFDVLACADIAVGGNPVGGNANDRRYRGRAHSLWFCDAEEETRYGWYETAFALVNPGGYSPTSTQGYRLRPLRGTFVPGSLHANEPSAHRALEPSPDWYLVAWPFTKVDVSHLDEFISRWASWLAASLRGELPAPTIVAVPGRSWRDDADLPPTVATPPPPTQAEPRSAPPRLGALARGLSEALDRVVGSRRGPSEPPSADDPPTRAMPETPAAIWQSGPAARLLPPEPRGHTSGDRRPPRKRIARTNTPARIESPAAFWTDEQPPLDGLLLEAQPQPEDQPVQHRTVALTADQEAQLWGMIDEIRAAVAASQAGGDPGDMRFQLDNIGDQAQEFVPSDLWGADPDLVSIDPPVLDRFMGNYRRAEKEYWSARNR